MSSEFVNDLLSRSLESDWTVLLQLKMLYDMSRDCSRNLIGMDYHPSRCPPGLGLNKSVSDPNQGKDGRRLNNSDTRIMP